MKYIQETGAVIDSSNEILSIVDGSAGSVDFPEELIWNIHKKAPGTIYELAHTHPPHMTEMSGRDKQTLKTFCFALYPFPVRLSVISEVNGGRFSKKTFLGLLEPKEVWQKSNRKERNFEIIEEREEVYKKEVLKSDWEGVLIDRSYIKNNG